MRLRPTAKNFFRGLVLVSCLLAGLGLMGPSARAVPGGASGLSISPLRQELNLAPGQGTTINLQLKNITGGPIIAEPAVRDFTSNNVNGNPVIITNPNAKNPASIKNFVTGLNNVDLGLNQQASYQVHIQIPKGTTPGAYYGLIVFQAVPNNPNNTPANNKVGLSAAVSELVFITVPGNVTERMELNAIHVYQDKQGTSEGLFFTSPPQAIGVGVTNLGNAFEKPFGTVTVKTPGGKVFQTYQVNGIATKLVVLPYSSRVFINPINKVSTPGPYTVNAYISYGPGATIMLGKKTFWYLPVWLIVIVVVVILLLILAVWLARRRYKRSRRPQTPAAA